MDMIGRCFDLSLRLSLRQRVNCNADGVAARTLTADGQRIVSEVGGIEEGVVSFSTGAPTAK